MGVPLRQRRSVLPRKTCAGAAESQALVTGGGACENSRWSWWELVRTTGNDHHARSALNSAGCCEDSGPSGTPPPSIWAWPRFLPACSWVRLWDCKAPRDAVSIKLNGIKVNFKQARTAVTLARLDVCLVLVLSD